MGALSPPRAGPLRLPGPKTTSRFATAVRDAAMPMPPRTCMVSRRSSMGARSSGAPKRVSGRATRRSIGWPVPTTVRTVIASL